MRRLLALPLFLLLLSVCFASAAAGLEKPTTLDITAEDIQSQVGTRWYGVYIGKKKIGWVKEVVELVGEGEAQRFRGGFEMFARLQRLNNTFEMQVTEHMEFDAQAPYALRGASARMSSDGEEKTIKLFRGEDGFKAEVAENGETRTLLPGEIDITLADHLTPIAWVRRGVKAGDRLVYRSFELDKLAIDRITSEVKAVKETVLDGVPTTFCEVMALSDMNGPMGTLRVDENGHMLSMVFGGLFEARLEPEEVAKQLETGVDMFTIGIARIDAPLGEAKAAKSMVLEVSGEGAASLESGPWQRVTPGEKEGTVLLATGKDVAEPVKATEEEVEKNLQETVEFPIRNEKVVALMKEATGDAVTARDKVDRLVPFVSNYIEDTYSVNPLSVLEVIEKRRGDCTEHSDLFTTLARAAGVPAREVDGLVYMGDMTHGFGWHAWNEVVIDGIWVPVDPTWGETELNATHIRFSAGGKGVGKVMEALGRLTLVARTVNGKKVEPAPPPKELTPPKTVPFVTGEEEAAE